MYMLSRDRNGLELTRESFGLLCRLLVSEHTVTMGYTTTKRRLQVLLESSGSKHGKIITVGVRGAGESNGGEYVINLKKFGGTRGVFLCIESHS